MSRDVPQGVLPDEVAECIGERHIAAAVFVTFQLEPGFFEDAVLGALFDCDSGRGDRVQRALLEDRLRESEVVVFYDRAGLHVDRTPRQGISLVPVTWNHHVLHAKHALLLLEREGDLPDHVERSLVLLTTSANLTRTGWWENVEVADLVELSEGAETSLAPDLRRLLALLRDLDPHHQHAALELVSGFVERLTPTDGLPRLWTGDEPLPEFLARHVDVGAIARVEAFAPYVSDDAEPLRALHDRLRPRGLWVRMPVDRDGSPIASEAWRDEVVDIPGARFAELPEAVDLSFGKGTSGTRFVHAKVLRVVSRDGRAWVLAGSPNLSAAAFAGRRRGNLETAILRATDAEPPWIVPLREEPRGAAESQASPETRAWTGVRLRVRFDWKRGQASYLLEDPAPVEVSLGRSRGSEPVLTLVVEPGSIWRPLPDDFAAWLRDELASSNVLSVRTGDDEPALLLVEEVERLERPDFLHAALTPGDILRYWSLRDPGAREAHLADIIERGTVGSDARGPERGERHTMFDSFAGLFHAFLCFRERLDALMRKGRRKAVVTRLLGRKHDALPTLLDKVLEDPEVDPVFRLLTLLSAREVVDAVRARAPELFAEHPDQADALDAQLGRLDEAWAALALQGDLDPEAFRDWYTAAWSAGSTEVAP